MDYRNCPKCGRMFVQIRAPICPSCEKAEEEIFMKVKEYIRAHPRNNIAVIAKETETTTKKILGYIREGRLELTSVEGVQLQCESCGKPIYIGRFCDNCIMKMNQDVATVFGKDKPQPKSSQTAGSRMYTSIKKEQEK